MHPTRIYNRQFNQRNNRPRRVYAGSLICGKKPRNVSMDDFKEFVEDILYDEDVDQSDYDLGISKRSIFIDFFNQEDLERVQKNHKYESYKGSLIHFNYKFKTSHEKTVHVFGIPLDSTAQELDDFLSQNYKIHEVSCLETSYEIPDKLFAEIYFENEEEAEDCIMNFKEWKGCKIVAFHPGDDSSAYSEYVSEVSSIKSDEKESLSNTFFRYALPICGTIMKTIIFNMITN